MNNDQETVTQIGTLEFNLSRYDREGISVMRVDYRGFHQEYNITDECISHVAESLVNRLFMDAFHGLKNKVVEDVIEAFKDCPKKD